MENDRRNGNLPCAHKFAFSDGNGNLCCCACPWVKQIGDRPTRKDDMTKQQFIERKNAE